MNYCDWKYCVDNSNGVNWENTKHKKCLACDGEDTSCPDYKDEIDITEKLGLK